ncbi:MAG: amidase [Parvibaculaceae bacterium]|nr:amidase [Parvibaculaceae bacterium]
MSGFPNYDDYDALGLAELVRKKEVTPQELLDEAIARTEKLDGKLNAVVIHDYDLARKQIADGLPDGPFTGVPFLLKDLHLLRKGTLTTFGSSLFKDNLADHDSTLTERYLAAGLVIFGKTSSPEFGSAPTTEPRLFGPSHNPWNLAHSPGGSSGGAAAAVAAGILPVANASDGGGSIRVPASACGIFGIKPTRARTPMGPDRGEGWGGMSISHVVSRSVRDSAAMLDATAGIAPGDPYTCLPPERPFLTEVTAKPARLKIAFTTRRIDGSLCHPDVVAAITETAKLLSGLGHHVEEKTPQIDQAAMGQHQATLIGANIEMTLRHVAAARGRAIESGEVEHITWLIAQGAKLRDSAAYVEATLFIHQLGRKMAAFHEEYDLFLCPTLGLPPVKLGEIDMMTSDVGNYLRLMGLYLPYAGYANMTGQPSMSVPLYWNSDKLPIGSMFTARYGDEATLFRLAGELEQARPWADKRPAL